MWMKGPLYSVLLCSLNLRIPRRTLPSSMPVNRSASYRQSMFKIPESGDTAGAISAVGGGQAVGKSGGAESAITAGHLLLQV